MAQIDDITTSLQLRPGIAEMNAALLKDLVQDAITEISDYINLEKGTDLPLGCISVVKDIVIIKVNKLGSEGISSESHEGISQSYIEDMPKDVQRKLRRYRKLPRQVV